MSVLLEIAHLTVRYPTSPRGRPAVDQVSLDIRTGETVALIGESGAGKSTVARSILQLVPARDGAVRFAGQDLGRLTPVELRGLRPRLQLIAQQPASALNPRLTAVACVAEVLALRSPHRAWRALQADALAILAEVGITPPLAARRPTQLSGGQCQRVAIARAIASEPSLLICDEATSAQDPLSQLQLIELLARLRAERAMSLLIISHDVAIVRQLATRVFVMHEGRVVESGAVSEVLARPRHPYTQALMRSIPRGIGVLPVPPRLVPPHAFAGAGCHYQNTCPQTQARCRTDAPAVVRDLSGRSVACWHAYDGDGQSR